MLKVAKLWQFYKYQMSLTNDYKKLMVCGFT